MYLSIALLAIKARRINVFLDCLAANQVTNNAKHTDGTRKWSLKMDAVYVCTRLLITIILLKLIYWSIKIKELSNLGRLSLVL